VPYLLTQLGVGRWLLHHTPVQQLRARQDRAEGQAVIERRSKALHTHPVVRAVSSRPAEELRSLPRG